jgi:hypothetical protein
MLKFLNKYYIVAILFFIAAIACIALPLIISMNNFVSAALVIAGMAYFILGSFAIIFSDNESFDPKIVGLLPVQLCVNLCRITANYMVYGGAYFVPTRITGEAGIMQYNPELMNSDTRILSKKTFASGKDKGLLTVPSCDPILQDLRKRNALVSPQGEDESVVLLNEVLSDVLEFSDQVSSTSGEHSVSITLHNYRFIEGCHFAHSVSPQCCTRFPCPVASLCGVIITEGVDAVVRLESCSVSPPGDITVIFSYAENQASIESQLSPGFAGPKMEIAFE